MSSSLPRERRKLPQRVQAPLSARLFFLIHQSRHAFYGSSVILLGLTILCLYSLGAWSARGLNQYLAHPRFSVDNAPWIVWLNICTSNTWLQLLTISFLLHRSKKFRLIEPIGRGISPSRMSIQRMRGTVFSGAEAYAPSSLSESVRTRSNNWLIHA